MDSWIGFLGGPLLAALIYFAGVHQGKKAERRHWAGVDERNAERQHQELVIAKVDRYLELAESHPPIAVGFSALLRLRLHELDSDERVRDAIERMSSGSRNDPLGPAKMEALEGVDLRRFFQHAADRHVDPSSASVADVLASMEDSDI